MAGKPAAQVRQATEAPVRKRPTNRKELIVKAAAKLFHERGYHGTAMSDIAAAVGVTSAALYRHVRTKQDLLALTIFEGMDTTEAAVADAAPGFPAFVRALAVMSQHRRDVPALWEREVRHLPAEQQRQMFERLAAFAVRTAALLEPLRPDLSEDDRVFLAWCVMSTLASPSYHSAVLPPQRFEQLLYELVMRLVNAPVLTAGPAGPTVAPKIPSARRERLLSAAARLFREQGFEGVGIEDIGAAAGITGPSVYHHFSSKLDLLVAVVTRGAEWIQLGAARALSDGGTPEKSLGLLLTSYVELALEHGDIVGTLTSEVFPLDADLQRIRRDHIAAWVRQLRSVRPELTEGEAQMTVTAVLMLANDVARLQLLSPRGSVGQDLQAIGEALLFS